MKIVKKIVIHPHIDNTLRKEVIDWCVDHYGDNETEQRWDTHSNYDRSRIGTFDVIFSNEKDAHWFLLKWGGEVVEVEAEYVYTVTDETFKNLFEYEDKS